MLFGEREKERERERGRERGEFAVLFISVALVRDELLMWSQQPLWSTLHP